MNKINKIPIQQLGYGFVSEKYLSKGRNENYFRFQVNPENSYHHLSEQQKNILIQNGNNADNWENILIKDNTDLRLIKDCTFYGLNRIGNLEPFYFEFSELRTPIGLYKSTIISCDLGDNVSINHVQLLSHYIIESEVILTNINEMSCTSRSKFGNGIVKDGEDEKVRIWLEICNENGGRRILPFENMLPGDAWLWTNFRENDDLLNAFKHFTEKQYSSMRGEYGIVGERTVIKNTNTIKDVKIGSDAYIKGANKLKNLTIHSAPNAKTQIGEGCELVNGIMGYGSRAFYGVKAVRFILSPFSQLKYGARLINSYLGDNSTISCCEVLNSFIFPAHEQHHNNSFLCAALIMGQSNIAAGATIGSNHNSRGADGEIRAGRGFWPGLCVSLKHNSMFSSFTMIAKGDYPAELNIPFPFSLVSNDLSKDELIIMPAYWFIYNMYAILRNEEKFANRDKRIEKQQLLEFDCLAPDTINEIFQAIKLLETFTGKAFYHKNEQIGSSRDYSKKGKSLLEQNNPIVKKLTILASGIENSKRNVKLIKVQEAYNMYKRMATYYGINQFIQFIRIHAITSIRSLRDLLPTQASRQDWYNVGGQLIPQKNVEDLLINIQSSNIQSWNEIHQFYKEQADKYELQKAIHGVSALMEIKNITASDFNLTLIQELLKEAIDTKEWITQNIKASKEKDYNNPFRKMVYNSPKEMEQVIGKLADNSFITNQLKELDVFKSKVDDLLTLLSVF